MILCTYFFVTDKLWIGNIYGKEINIKRIEIGVFSSRSKSSSSTFFFWGAFTQIFHIFIDLWFLKFLNHYVMIFPFPLNPILLFLRLRLQGQPSKVLVFCCCCHLFSSFGNIAFFSFSTFHSSLSSPVDFCQIYQILLNPINSCQIMSNVVKSCIILSNPVKFCQILSNLVYLSNPVLFYHIHVNLRSLQGQFLLPCWFFFLIKPSLFCLQNFFLQYLLRFVS